MGNEKKRPLLVPVFDHLYNLYDDELKFYINIWETELKKEGCDQEGCEEKLRLLYEEKQKRQEGNDNE